MRDLARNTFTQVIQLMTHETGDNDPADLLLCYVSYNMMRCFVHGIIITSKKIQRKGVSGCKRYHDRDIRDKKRDIIERR